MDLSRYQKKVPFFPPVLEKESDDHGFWWRGDAYVVGRITCLERQVRIINTLTRKTIFMNVCEEDSIETIKRKYKKAFNSNADSYTWRKTHFSDPNPGRLSMSKTLTQNNLPYRKHEQLGLPPALWLFFVLNKD
jgi:hypothetical protein